MRDEWRRRRRSAAAAKACLLLCVSPACKPALREPPPLVAPPPPEVADGPPGSAAERRSNGTALGASRGTPNGTTAGSTTRAGALLAAAEQAWLRRADLAAARDAERLYMNAAALDDHDTKGLLGAMRAKTYLIEHETSAETRRALAVSAVQAGQWCERRARATPAAPACALGLAIALGQQAREDPGTADDAMKHMVALLQQAIAADPSVEGGGPHRVLALLLLRAPGWPVGPGDAEAALREAQAAVHLAPERADNLLVLAEALGKNERASEARTAGEEALRLAMRAAERGDPDAVDWVAQARAAAPSP